MKLKNLLRHKSVKLSKKISLIVFFLIALGVISCAQQITDQPIVHDPVMIKQNNTYYLFCTGWGIGMFSSPDMVNWKKEEAVFNSPPIWATEAVKDFKGHIWAPDIFFYKGVYYLYYSVSSFAKNTSCIGLVTNKTLNPKDPDYKWVDHGKIVQSVPGRDMWNAIDPNVVIEESGVPWLTFGSFWNGIKMVKLSSDLKSIDMENQEWHTLSSRPRSFTYEDVNPGDAAVEAPFIFKKGNYYYLFVSFDYCCRGVKSNYKIVVGRSQKVTGPYIDKEGIKMEQGGGTILLKGNGNWPGVGHNSVYHFDGKDYLVFHAYDANDNGKPKLKITEISWDKDGWPIVSIE